MLLLAIDTSTRQSSVALCTENEVYGEYTWYAGSNHSVELLENTRRIIAECQMTMEQIDAVVVATGPGSFNGVRVALAAAKTLAFALSIPLIGMSTLDVIAAQQQQWSGPLCAVLDAGRSELYAACYSCDQSCSEDGYLVYSMRRVSDYLLMTASQLASYVHDLLDNEFSLPGERALTALPMLFSGEIHATARQTLQSHLHEDVVFAAPLQAVRRASVMVPFALQRLQEGKLDDPLLLEPLYLRRPSITTSSRKQSLLNTDSQHKTGQSKTEREEGALRH